MPDVLIVEARFRGRVQQVFVNGRLDFQIPVDSAVPEFDFEGTKPFTVTDCGERSRFDRYPLYPGDDALGFERG